MVETYVRLLCPACAKQWEVRPADIPAPNESFSCPGCNAERRTAEFARTNHDLAALKSLR